VTPIQIQLVRDSWARVLPIQAAAADLFYARLFELAPETRPLFKRDIHAQGAMLMKMLDTIVASLDRLDTLLPVAGQLARRHVGYGVQPQHYDIVGTALVWTLEQGLGQDFTPQVRQAWLSAYSTLACAMQDAAADAVPARAAA
jgi:nitric oxide dioxygenase